MTKLRCCFCQQELEQVSIHDIQCLACPKLECNGYFMTATKDMWQELIRTRKVLEWARHFLKEIRLRYLIEKDEPSRQNKWWDTALYMYNLAEDFFNDYDKTNETKGGDNE